MTTEKAPVAGDCVKEGWVEGRNQTDRGRVGKGMGSVTDGKQSMPDLLITISN